MYICKTNPFFLKCRIIFIKINLHLFFFISFISCLGKRPVKQGNKNEQGRF